MRTITLGKHTIRIYDSIDDLPIVNFQKYNKYLLIDSGVGSDVEAIGAHTNKLAELITAGDTKKALIELQNMQQNILFAMNNISPECLAFVSLIASIDGKDVSDYSDEGLKQLIDNIKNEKHTTVSKLLAAFKKKIDYELSMYFPDLFLAKQDVDMTALLKKRIQLLCSSVCNGQNKDKELAELDRQILAKYRPKLYSGVHSFEIKLDKQFEISCAVIGQKTGLNAKTMTTLQYYTTVSHINDMAKQEQKSFKQHTHGRR